MAAAGWPQNQYEAGPLYCVKRPSLAYGLGQMVKPNFSNLQIEVWVYPGKLGFSQPSLCLFHESPKEGKEILDALTELQQDTGPARRTLTFKDCLRKSTLPKLTLMLVSQREDLAIMSIRCDREGATIEMTRDGVALLASGVTSWLAGAEDFGVSPRHSKLKPNELGKLDRESAELWFWGPFYAGP
jgi:hypothetical protein